MKLLADRLLAMPQTRDPLIEAARSALLLPDRNHAPSEDRWRAAYDRYVFDEKTYDQLIASFRSSQLLDEAYSLARPPLPHCWIEYNGRGQTFGFLVEEDSDGEMVVAFLKSKENFALPVLMFDLKEVRAGPNFDIRLTGFSPENDGSWQGDLVCQCVVMFAALFANRMVSTERVLPSIGRRAHQASLRRHQQRGRPWYSYNIVREIRPQTSLQRGIVQAAMSVAGKRQHMVEAHPRLIDKVPEPYWIWVKGHRRGNKELGWVAKERHVEFENGGVRRGFLIPDFPGTIGMRLPAVRA